MPNGMVQPAQIQTPNIAGAMAQGMQIRGAQESRNIARQQLDVSRSQAKTGRINAAAGYEAKQLERAKSLVDLMLVLLPGVSDQDSLDRVRDQAMTVIPPNEHEKMQGNIDKLFGVKYNKKRIEQAKKQLAASKGQLDKIMPDVGGRKLTGEAGQFEQVMGRKPTTPKDLQSFLKAKRPPPQPTVTERELLRRQKAMGKLQTKAATDPNEVYRLGYQMDDDGSLFIDPVDNAPVKLRTFDKVLGKRGTITAIKTIGEQWDDAKEIQTLLQDPKVKADLQSANQEAGLWDRVKGTWSNEVKLWMQKKGIGANTKTYTAIIRMQRYASEERKRFLGTAVTASEIQTAIPWLPDAGDSFEVMTNKIGVAAFEGEQGFRRWMDMYKNIANMTPLYKAFGIQRFDGSQGQGGQVNVGDLSDEELLRQLGGR
jgi:hypothetical protein